MCLSLDGLGATLRAGGKGPLYVFGIVRASLGDRLQSQSHLATNRAAAFSSACSWGLTAPSLHRHPSSALAQSSPPKEGAVPGVTGRGLCSRQTEQQANRAAYNS